MPDRASYGILVANCFAAVAVWAGVLFSWLRSGKEDEDAKNTLAVDIDKAVSTRIQASGIEDIAISAKSMAEHAKKEAQEAKDLVAWDKQALLFSIKVELTRIDKILKTNNRQLLEPINGKLVYRVSGCTENTETVVLVQAAYSEIQGFDKQFVGTPKLNHVWGNAWDRAEKAVQAALAQIENNDAFYRACTRREETGSDE